MEHQHGSSGFVCGTCHPELMEGIDVDALWQRAQEARAERARDMPDDEAALRAMQRAHTRLKEMGWRPACYGPKDGTMVHLIEPGSSGIHTGYYSGEWPTGGWWIVDGETWPSTPCLFREIPPTTSPTTGAEGGEDGDE